MSSALVPDRNYTEEEFWNSRPLLKNVKWWASRTVKSPYAILAWIMVRMLSRIPFDTHYVTKTGKNTLNLTVNISGDTGTGKTAARKIADSEKICKFMGTYWFSVPLVQLRSGEAAGDSFWTRVKKTLEDGSDVWEDEWINLNHSIIFFFDEVLFFIGKQRQNSSTLVSVLLSMWSGEMLGGALTGGKGKTVEAGSYRAVVVINSQKENDPFRTDSSGYSGETSRVLNVRSTNPNARRDFESVKDKEPPFAVEIPRFGGEGTRMSPDFYALPEMEAAQEEQDFLASEGLHDRTRSHEVLQRSKIACILASLDGRTELNHEDWHLALHLIEHSREVDREIREAQHRASRSEAGKAGAILGIRMDAAEDSKEKAQTERVSKNLKRWAPEVGYDLALMPHEGGNPIARTKLMAKISGRDRKDDFVDLVLSLIYSELNAAPDITIGGDK
jgi:hypothetical protein